MTKAPAASRPAKGVSRDRLARRILALSADMKPRKASPKELIDDLAREREQAEEEFYDALCRRTWWRMMPEERSALRTQIIAKDVFARDRAQSRMVDYACLKEIRRILEEQ